MADERSVKLRKLNAFRRSVPHVSGSALAAILDEVEQSGLPELHSRWDLQKATTMELDHETPYGNICDSLKLAAKSGGRDIQIPFVNPHAHLYRAFSFGGAFTKLMLERLAAVPPTPDAPWRLVLYSDEVVPGNALSHDNKRKVWVVYFSWLEFEHLLSNEDAWFCILIARSSEVNKVSAGMGQIFGDLLKRFFADGGHDMRTAGLTLRSPNGIIARLFCKLGMVLQDGGAHKTVWGCKGDAGSKLCMLCKNLYAQVSGLVDEDGTDLLTCS